MVLSSVLQVNGDQALCMAWLWRRVIVDEGNRIADFMIASHLGLKRSDHAGEGLALCLAARLNSGQIDDTSDDCSVGAGTEVDNAIEDGHGTGGLVAGHVVGLDCENEV